MLHLGQTFHYLTDPCKKKDNKEAKNVRKTSSSSAKQKSKESEVEIVIN